MWLYKALTEFVLSFLQVLTRKKNIIFLNKFQNYSSKSVTKYNCKLGSQEDIGNLGPEKSSYTTLEQLVV